jgi:hypothetical protein
MLRDALVWMNTNSRYWTNKVIGALSVSAASTMTGDVCREGPWHVGKCALGVRRRGPGITRPPLSQALRVVVGSCVTAVLHSETKAVLDPVNGSSTLLVGL